MCMMVIFNSMCCSCTFYCYAMHCYRNMQVDKCHCLIIMPPPRRGGGALSGHRRPSSVCLMSRTSALNSKTKRPRKTKLCTGVPQVTCDSHTDFRSKGRKSRSRGGGVLWRPPSRTACYVCSLLITNQLCMPYIHWIGL